MHVFQRGACGVVRPLNRLGRAAGPTRPHPDPSLPVEPQGASVRAHRRAQRHPWLLRSITPKHATSLAQAPAIGPSAAAGIAPARSHPGHPGRRYTPADRRHLSRFSPPVFPSDGRPEFIMSVLCQMAWSGKTDSRRRSVTVGTISNSATPSRLVSAWPRASLHRVPGSASGRVALLPVFARPGFPPLAWPPDPAAPRVGSAGPRSDGGTSARAAAGTANQSSGDRPATARPGKPGAPAGPRRFHGPSKRSL
jgi:hypothetical protein